MGVKILLLVAIVVIAAEAGSVPQNLKPCKAKDANCLKEVVQAMIPVFAAGLPEYKVHTMDPMAIKKVDASSNNLKFVITDAVTTGMGACKVKKALRDVPINKMYLTLQCDSEFKGQYELDGRILVLPIQGKGGIYVKLRKIEINVEIEVSEKLGKDQKQHWVIKNWSYTFDLLEKADLVFENLFEDNEVLGKAARELIATASNDVIKEIGPPVIKAITAKIIANIQRFFRAVPIEDLTLDV